ncbi:MAG TPA: hypothetical protein VF648_07065 [Pyrinomonadaceae bacterium]|jgi:hypothetical protein
MKIHIVTFWGYGDETGSIDSVWFDEGKANEQAAKITKTAPNHSRSDVDAYEIRDAEEFLKSINKEVSKRWLIFQDRQSIFRFASIH